MLTLEQVRQLEIRVKKAVDLIETLRNENSMLTERLARSEGRLRELETLIDGFKNDQDLIEKGIKDILNQLNSLEDDLHTEQEIKAPGSEAVESAESAPAYIPEPPVQSPSPGNVQQERYIQEDDPEDFDIDDEEDSSGQLDIF